MLNSNDGNLYVPFDLKMTDMQEVLSRIPKLICTNIGKYLIIVSNKWIEVHTNTNNICNTGNLKEPTSFRSVQG